MFTKHNKITSISLGMMGMLMGLFSLRKCTGNLQLSRKTKHFRVLSLSRLLTSWGQINLTDDEALFKTFLRKQRKQKILT